MVVGKKDLTAYVRCVIIKNQIKIFSLEGASEARPRNNKIK